MNCRLLVSACVATLVTLAMTVPAQAQAKLGDGKGREGMLKRFDKDGDGQLSESEKVAAKEAFEKMRGARGGKPGAGAPGGGREEMMKKFDKDGDGKLSDSEKQAMIEAMKARGGAGGKPDARPAAGGKPGAGGDRMAEMIKRFDKDGDGQLSEAEKKAAMEARGGAGKRPPKN
jgi:Ca2+-binding EF-hand superfamily protein